VGYIRQLFRVVRKKSFVEASVWYCWECTCKEELRMLQGATNKTILLTLMCAGGAVMVFHHNKALCGLIKKYPTILFFLLNKKALGARNGSV